MKRELTKYLKSLDEKGLYKEVQMLYSKIPEVAKYYEMEFSPNTDKIVADYKKKLEKEYFPSRGFGKARNGVSRKIVTDFKKISIYPSDEIDLWLYRTEMMAQFTVDYGDMDETFYNSLLSGFETACKLIEKEKLEKQFQSRCYDIVHNVYDRVGWGLDDDLKVVYEDYFGEFVK
jgi:hypothetical protein